jgi:hypothetical protein
MVTNLLYVLCHAALSSVTSLSLEVRTSTCTADWPNGLQQSLLPLGMLLAAALLAAGTLTDLKPYNAYANQLEGVTCSITS